MNVVVIDGQGGMLGCQLIRMILQRYPDLEITAIGTNAIASAAMKKAGAHWAAAGENPVVVACRKADVIIGPVGIVIADSLTGEVTPKMALAVAQADAARILIPSNRCNNLIAGVPDLSVGVLVADAVEKLSRMIDT